ncbi:UNVERIFIED_CONTAM: hypothetical protein Slati_3439000, partial [Sesamum latifolium]
RIITAVSEILRLRIEKWHVLTKEMTTDLLREIFPYLLQLVLPFHLRCMSKGVQYPRVVLPTAIKPLLGEQLQQFILETVNGALRGSQVSGTGQPFQPERSGTPSEQETNEQVPANLQHDGPILAEPTDKEVVPLRLPESWYSIMKRMIEFRQGVRREVPLMGRGIPFSADIIDEELPTHFRAPSHLPTYSGTTDPTEHIHKFENIALLHNYSDYIKCCVFLTILTDSAQQWVDQLPIGIVRSFAEFVVLFLYQFASSKKCQKSTISLFGVKQEEKETLGHISSASTRPFSRSRPHT